jgi:hypothetical protein
MRYITEIIVYICKVIYCIKARNRLNSRTEKEKGKIFVIHIASNSSIRRLTKMKIEDEIEDEKRDFLPVPSRIFFNVLYLSIPLSIVFSR